MMKTVECNFCVNFIPIVIENDNLFGKIITNAQCKLGKKVMFRKGTEREKYSKHGGYFRNCDEFNAD